MSSTLSARRSAWAKLLQPRSSARVVACAAPGAMRWSAVEGNG
ncbi:hypothetical protein [Streptomyces sp. GC420]|nr:hypothetical protein [Streptomyces sp. GC420]